VIPAFLAVVPVLSPEVGDVLIAAGAAQVLTWAEFAGTPVPAPGPGSEPDGGDPPVILLDEAAGGADVPLADLAAALERLLAADPGAGPGSTPCVVATTAPVTDTLKQVDGAGTVRGTAPREQHRFVRAPLAARRALLLAVSDEVDPGAGERAGKGSPPEVAALLTAMVGRGAAVHASRG
jgi:2-C-methyl-D-erythritol 4-phosphate cytidylyltransferase